jgi:hypothetical protein
VVEAEERRKAQEEEARRQPQAGEACQPGRAWPWASASCLCRHAQRSAPRARK